MGTHHPIRKTVAPVIPDKLYFRIGDVARLCEVPAYVLRFWETEFPQLKPNKGGTGQRLYRKRDVEMALRIKSLLYDQGYTIPGARQVFKTEPKSAELKTPDAPKEMKVQPFGLVRAASDTTAETGPRDVRVLALKAEMQSLLELLNQPAAKSAPKAGKLQAMRPRLTVESSRSQQLSLEGDLF